MSYVPVGFTLKSTDEFIFRGWQTIVLLGIARDTGVSMRTNSELAKAAWGDRKSVV